MPRMQARSKLSRAISGLDPTLKAHLFGKVQFAGDAFYTSLWGRYILCQENLEVTSTCNFQLIRCNNSTPWEPNLRRRAAVKITCDLELSAFIAFSATARCSRPR